MKQRKKENPQIGGTKNRRMFGICCLINDLTDRSIIKSVAKISIDQFNNFCSTWVTEMWAVIQESGTRQQFLPSPSSFVSFSLFYSFFLNSFPSFISSSSLSLNLFSSSPHIAFLSSHLPSTSLSHSSSHLFCRNPPNLPARPSYPVILSPLSPPLSPSCPFCNSFFLFCSPPPILFREPLSSRLLKHSRLSSPLPGQGSTTAHFTHDRVCCMPVMYVCC